MRCVLGLGRGRILDGGAVAKVGGRDRVALVAGVVVLENWTW